MRFARLVPVLFVLGAAAPAQAISETAEGFAAAMQGCWNRTALEGASSQMCLEGGVEGVLTLVECYTNATANLTECGQLEGTYAFRDEKFWRVFDGVEDSCDVFLEPRKSVTLQNCAWTEPPPGLDATGDTVYERAIGQ